MPAWWEWKSTKNNKDQQNQDKNLKDNSIFSTNYQKKASSVVNNNEKKPSKKSFDDVSTRSSSSTLLGASSGFSGFDSDRIGHPLPQPSISPTTSFGIMDLHGYPPGSASVSSSGDSSVSSADDHNLDHGQLGILRGYGESKFSPQPRSPGPGSRAATTNTSPLHPRFGGSSLDSPNKRLDECHPLPLPPTSPTSPSAPLPTTRICSSPTRPSIVKNVGAPENSNYQLSKWKKGRLLGRGTFGHVYLGFNRCELSFQDLPFKKKKKRGRFRGKR